MKNNTIVPGDRQIMAIVYKDIPQKLLGFIASEVAGSTEPGVPYLSCHI